MGTRHFPLLPPGGVRRSHSFSLPRHLSRVRVPTGPSTPGSPGLHRGPPGGSAAPGGPQHRGKTCVWFGSWALGFEFWVLGGGNDLNLLVLQVARSLGILDEVNKMKVLPGASTTTSHPNKNVRYMEVGGSFGKGAGLVLIPRLYLK